MKIFLILVLTSLVGCALADTDLCAANDQFNKKLLQVILTEKPGNVVLSSFSLFTPLAQLVLASGGNTRAEILRTLTIPAKDIDCTLKEALPTVNNKLRRTTGITFTDASKIYLKNSLKLNYQFEVQTKAIFGSLIEPVDFNSPLTVYNINKWVAEQTNNKITQTLDPGTSLLGTEVMLVNTVYFKAKWAAVFATAATYPDIFHTSETNQIRIPFMHQTAHLSYSESVHLQAKLLELPYEGYTSKLLIVVPNAINGLPNVLEKLDSATLNREKKLLQNTKVALSLPKFKIETETDLKKTLGALGINELFRNANLTNLLANNQGVTIGAAFQKAFITVDEGGTEAGAVNVFPGVGSSSNPQKIIDVVINRPFYFEVSVGSVKLFSGCFYTL